MERFRASGLSRLPRSWAHPVLCPVDVVARAAERIHARLDRLPGVLVGTVLAMFNLIHVTHGTGMLTLVPGGLFELILPIWLVAKGFASPRITR